MIDCVFSFEQLSSCNYPYDSSLSALRVFLASIQWHCHYFHDQNMLSLVLVELESCCLIGQFFQEIRNWQESMERGIPKTKPPPGLKLQFHSCLYCCLLLRPVRKVSQAKHSYLLLVCFCLLEQQWKLPLMEQDSLLGEQELR